MQLIFKCHLTAWLLLELFVCEIVQIVPFLNYALANFQNSRWLLDRYSAKQFVKACLLNCMQMDNSSHLSSRAFSVAACNNLRSDITNCISILWKITSRLICFQVLLCSLTFINLKGKSRQKWPMSFIFIFEWKFFNEVNYKKVPKNVLIRTGK